MNFGKSNDIDIVNNSNNYCCITNPVRRWHYKYVCYANQQL